MSNLVAAKTKYHDDCLHDISFIKLNKGVKVDHLKEKDIVLAMEDIFAYIENHDDYQFT